MSAGESAIRVRLATTLQCQHGIRRSSAGRPPQPCFRRILRYTRVCALLERTDGGRYTPQSNQRSQAPARIAFLAAAPSSPVHRIHYPACAPSPRACSTPKTTATRSDDSKISIWSSNPTTRWRVAFGHNARPRLPVHAAPTMTMTATMFIHAADVRHDASNVIREYSLVTPDTRTIECKQRERLYVFVCVGLCVCGFCQSDGLRWPANRFMRSASAHATQLIDLHTRTLNASTT